MIETPTVLLVDDNEEVRAALGRQFRTRGYAVIEASDGQRALNALPVIQTDAVVADFDMPGMDGLELLQRVRLLRPHVVRILLTGQADVHVAARALNEGAADRLLLKPWNRVDITSIVAILMRARDTRAQPASSGTRGSASR